MEQSKGFYHHTLLGELIYLYITCQPVIGYSVTTLSKFSFILTTFHYKLLKVVEKYLWSTFNWGIWLYCSKTLSHPNFSLSKWYNLKNSTSVPFDINITQPFLVGFVYVTHANNLCKQRSTTGLLYTFCFGAIIYKSKIQ